MYILASQPSKSSKRMQTEAPKPYLMSNAIIIFRLSLLLGTELLLGSLS